VDAKFVNPFIVSIKRVFETMVKTTVNVGKPEIATSDKGVADVSGVIGLSGDVSGCVVLSFPMDVASKVVAAFADSAVQPEHPDFADAVGELANMIAGGAKAQFPGVRVSISLPSVIIGKQHVVSQSRAYPRVLIPCQTSFGSMFVEVAMLANKASRAMPVQAEAVA
jgi:chemotaxis protein CheX